MTNWEHSMKATPSLIKKAGGNPADETFIGFILQEIEN